jgi:hypothetical protein
LLHLHLGVRFGVTRFALRRGFAASGEGAALAAQICATPAVALARSVARESRAREKAAV